jgi:hypothetical protein
MYENEEINSHYERSMSPCKYPEYALDSSHCACAFNDREINKNKISPKKHHIDFITHIKSEDKNYFSIHQFDPSFAEL